MARGEYESQKALAEILPDNVAVPLAFGTFQLDSSKSFYITPFRELMDKIATPTALAELLKTLHTTSRSPTGKFGFHVQTFNGVVPVINDWCDSWEAWFTRQFKADILWEQSVCGRDPEFDAVADEFFAKVIPRLLRPLETGGRYIKPSLLHGDIWHGNCQIDADTQKVILFDSCCCYGHNERKTSPMFGSSVGTM